MDGAMEHASLVALGEWAFGSGFTVHELAHRTFPPAVIRIRAVGDVSIKVFGDRNLRRQLAP